MTEQVSLPIHERYSLKELNTLAVESEAEYFAEPADRASLLSALAYARNHNLDVKVLGGGSNLVMREAVSGLVIRYQNAKLRLIEESSDHVLVDVGAGYSWHQFVLDALKRDWFGLENLALIPGAVGAAPVQNIGAYGVEVEQFIERVEGLYLSDSSPFSLKAEQCEFAYRESIFKQSLDGKVLITNVIFRLSKKAAVNTTYAPLEERARQEGQPSPMTLANWVMEVRQSKLPDPSVLPNAGSFFKNPIILKTHFDALKEEYPNLPGYPVDALSSEGEKSVKIAAGWLIDQLGFKGRSMGLIKVHDLQALVLVNMGGQGSDVLAAAHEIKQAVRQHYGICLEQEPRIFS